VTLKQKRKNERQWQEMMVSWDKSGESACSQGTAARPRETSTRLHHAKHAAQQVRVDA
jgi:hypothetical protein